MMDPRRAAPNPEDGFILPDASRVKLLFDNSKTLSEIANALGVSPRSVVNLRQESKSKAVLDEVENTIKTFEQSTEQALSIWLYRRLNQIHRDARQAAFHAAEPARRK